jgi:hypothetical protein
MKIETILIFLFLGSVEYRMLYSPSDPLGETEEEEEMDWAVNLGGVSTLYEDLEDLEPVTTTGTGTGSGLSGVETAAAAAVEPHPAESAAGATVGKCKEATVPPPDGGVAVSEGGDGGTGGSDSARFRQYTSRTTGCTVGPSTYPTAGAAGAASGGTLRGPGGGGCGRNSGGTEHPLLPVEEDGGGGGKA